MMEAVVMIAALALIFAVLVAKVMTTQLLGHMNRQISQVAANRQEVMNRLKTAQGQKMVLVKNKAILEKKKTKVTKQISRLKKEMSGYKEEEDARRQRSESRRIV
jgi:t-SNARE complex subunit (syntaxin)